MMHRRIPWFFPAECGDFTLVGSDSASETVLTVTDPTHADVQILTPFLARIEQLGWSDATAISPSGATILRIRQPLQRVAEVLAGVKFADAPSWTAIRATSGEISYVSGVPTLPAEASTEVAAVVTGRQVDRGCPEPSPASRRASRVLRAFTTKAQWESWVARGHLDLRAQVSREPYRIYHRGVAARLGLPRIAVRRTGAPMALCAWDWSIPPEEEALAVKLGLEHAEEVHTKGGFVTIPWGAVVRAGLQQPLPHVRGPVISSPRR